MGASESRKHLVEFLKLNEIKIRIPSRYQSTHTINRPLRYTAGQKCTTKLMKVLIRRRTLRTKVAVSRERSEALISKKANINRRGWTPFKRRR